MLMSVYGYNPCDKKHVSLLFLRLFIDSFDIFWDLDFYYLEFHSNPIHDFIRLLFFIIHANAA